MIKVYSFDVFDTTLTRIVAKPGDIFAIVRSKLQKLRLGLPEELIKDFTIIRKQAAIRARLLRRVEDITIGDIYACIGKRHALSEKILSGLITIETDAELESVYPVQWTVSEIKKLRESRARIIFASDSYLPDEVIKNMLFKVGAYKTGDSIYVSGAIGSTKIWGSLYRHILEHEHCSAGELSHYGDNPYSDIFVPAKLGIKIYSMSDDDMRKFFKQHLLYNMVSPAMAAIKRLYLK